MLDDNDIDRVSGTRLGTIWFLPVFGVVLPWVALMAGSDISPGTRWFWNAAGMICWSCFAWAWLERARARKLIRFLHAHAGELGAGGIEHGGVRLMAGTPLVQYQTKVSLLIVGVTLTTAPRLHGRAIVPSLVTLLFGWWEIPWGPVHTVRILLQNARGGRTITAQELLAEVSRPPAPKEIWWRRTLALDSGSTLQIVLNVLVAGVLLLVGGLLIAATIASLLRPG